MSAANGSGGAGAGAGGVGGEGGASTGSNAPANSVTMGPEPKRREPRSPAPAAEAGDSERRPDVKATLAVMDRRARVYGDSPDKSAGEKVAHRVETTAAEAARAISGPPPAGRGKTELWVEADIREFKKSDEKKFQDAVATKIGENARANPEYQRLLRELEPQLAERSQTAVEKQRAAEAARDRAQLALEANYVVVGREYRFRTDESRVAFRDEGRKYTTEYNTSEVARGILDGAQSKGWRSVTVTGTEEFQRNVWMEAQARGMTVRGYTPTRQDRELAERATRDTNVVAKNGRERDDVAGGQTPESPRAPRSAKPAAEQILAMGAANYNFDKREDMSYYIQLRDGKGKERYVWGKDLERAASDAGVGVGDAVRLRVTEKKPVEVVVNIRDAQDRVVGREPKSTRRNEWEIEKVDVRAEAPGRVVDQMLEKKGASRELRERVGDAVDQEYARRAADGRAPEVRVFDDRAPREVPRPQRQVDPGLQRDRGDRGSPSRG